MNYIQKGWVDVNAEPSLEREFGALRVYNGNMGPGVLNALYCADRAMELADQYGIGMVGIRNTTHWMRGGTYGLYAARKGYAAIMWTNTESCMPPWGGRECRLGNNPFVMAVPSADGGEPLQLDMAMSQYSYGKLQVTRLAGEKLPYPGGFDDEGNLTDDPSAIEQSRRVLPVGYWKGSAFSFMLDILGSVLTDGIGAAGMDQKGYGSCGGCSQVMIVVDPGRTTTDAHMKKSWISLSWYVKSSAPSEEGGQRRGRRAREAPGSMRSMTGWGFTWMMMSGRRYSPCRPWELVLGGFTHEDRGKETWRDCQTVCVPDPAGEHHISGFGTGSAL